MDTRRVDEYLKRLTRRSRFLEKRVEDKPYANSHHDRAELLALNWIIRYTEDTIIQASEHHRKWHSELRDTE